jgi:hypothetical protein
MSYGEEDTCHMKRRIGYMSYEEEDTYLDASAFRMLVDQDSSSLV